MSDVYMPGVKSRFNSEQIIEGLMKVERAPKERTEKSIETLESRKGWWQDLGRRISSLRESSRMLFSFQNPFNERVASSSNEDIISATATREADEQQYRFTVKQLAQADRFLSPPLDEKTKIDAGNYTFTVGVKEEITFNFKGGTLREFTDALNRRGRDKLGASLLTVKPGTKSLLLESKLTGAENRLGFSGDAALMAVKLGMAEQVNNSRRDIALSGDTVQETPPQGNAQPTSPVAIEDGTVRLPPLAAASVPFSLAVEQGSPLAFKIETATTIHAESPLPIPQPPPGPSVPSSGSISYGGITIENAPSAAPLPAWIPPPPQVRSDNLAVLSLSFSDGTSAALPPITDTGDFEARQYNLGEIAGGKTITALNIDNTNTHRDIAIRGALVFDPEDTGGGYKPTNAVSSAQDAVISMEGIEMTRPSNIIDDIIPGVTITAKGVSEKAERLEIRPDREGVKEAIISLVGNYNRLMAELNILTRTDEQVINELTYLEKDEIEEMQKRLGAFSAESSVTQFKANLLRAVSSPYPTDAERDLSMLAHIGISTNPRNPGGTGINASRLRGYLEIDEKVLDSALERNLPAIKQLFGSDTTGDLIVNSGVAFNLDNASRPFVETGGIISLKTGTIDSRISQDKRRIDTMDRQLAAKEMDLKIQYSRMESAYARMEQMSSSFDNLGQQGR